MDFSSSLCVQTRSSE